MAERIAAITTPPDDLRVPASRAVNVAALENIAPQPHMFVSAHA
jgi:hypothetical protein